MKTVFLALFTVLLLSCKSHCEDDEESTKLMDNETVQKFIKQLVGLLNQGTSNLVGGSGNAPSNYQDASSYQRPISDFTGLDYSDPESPRPPFYNRPYRPNYGRPGAPGRPGLLGNQQGQLGNLLGLLGQGGLQGLGGGQYGQYGSQSYLGHNTLGQNGLGQYGFGQFGQGQFGQGGIDAPVPYPYAPKPPTNRPYPVGSYQQQSLLGALYSIAQYDDLRCVPRLLCEVTAGSRPGGPYYSTYGQNQQTSIVPFLSKDSLVTILTVLNFVDESPYLVFGRAALLGYTARGDPRQCLTAYPLCPRNPDQLVEYLNNHNGGFFRFFNQQLPHIPQYAPYYQNNYQSLQSSFPNGLYNKQPYRKFKKFTKLYDTENSKKLPQQYADKNQKYYKEPRILYGKEGDNKVTFDTLPENDFGFQAQSNQDPNFSSHHFAGEISSGHRGGKKLKFQEEPESVYSPESSSSIEVSHSNAYQTFFPSESQDSHTFSFPSADFNSVFHQPFNRRRPKAMTFPDKTGTGNLVLEQDKYGNYVVRKDRDEPLLESANKVKFVNEDYTDYNSQPFYNRYNKRASKRLFFPEDEKAYIS